jgi:parvulin-like peptidyl-prolyl isomerase
MTLHRNRYFISAALALLFLPAFPALVSAAKEAAGAATEEAPALVARIGDEEVITEEEFERNIGAIMQRAQRRNRGQGGPLTLSNEERLKILNDLADVKVLYLVAKDAGTLPTDEEMKSQLDEMRDELGAQLPPGVTFEDALKSSGTSIEEYSEIIIRPRLTIQKYMEALNKEIQVTDEEVAKRYEDMKVTQALSRPQETVDVAHILVKVASGAEEEAWTEAKTRIDAARERIVTGGEDFGAVAAVVSEDEGSKKNGGLYREVPRGKMVPEFDKASFETPVGDVTEPFRTQFGWHFLTVQAKHEAGVMTLEEVAESLTGMIEGEKRTEKLKSIITEAKEKKYKVEILLVAEPEKPAEDTGAVIIDGST